MQLRILSESLEIRLQSKCAVVELVVSLGLFVEQLLSCFFVVLLLVGDVGLQLSDAAFEVVDVRTASRQGLLMLSHELVEVVLAGHQFLFQGASFLVVLYHGGLLSGVFLNDILGG